ncbi:MAG TPA: response regulator [Candidatus Acidoferrum sp.]|nr:response regulator [Candidatus Acidoferrum sp.]
MPPTAEFSWRNASILIADDEPDMREIFAAWLRNLGCTVTEVSDGEEALNALALQKFDAVVTDVRMPRLNGIQLVRRLKQSGEYIPVIIFVSGFVDLPLPDAYDLGVEAVLAKPCLRKELTGALCRSIQRRQLAFEPDLEVVKPGPEDDIRQNFVCAVDESTVAVGRGGVSLETGLEVAPGAATRFSLFFDQGPLRALHGWGVVRWCETVSQRVRAGIEFMDLGDDCRHDFATWLQDASPSSFIPKERHSKPSR